MTRSSPESSPSRISENLQWRVLPEAMIFSSQLLEIFSSVPGGHKPVSKRISKSYLDESEFDEESDNTLIHELLGEDKADGEEVSNLYD